MSREIYDKVYFNDEYSRQFSELRDRYHDRTQKALNGRKTDREPMPNATTVVLMDDTFDGGVTITTGDFVSFYNQRCGRDRIGEMRRSLATAAEKVELKRVRAKRAEERAKAEKETAKKQKTRATGRKPVRHMRFSFAHALFALMLVLSVVMFFGTSALLDSTVEELKAMEEKVDVAQANEPAAVSYEAPAVSERTVLSGEESVEVYTPTEEEGFSMTALLNALAALGKKE
jgi:hypothetical protein